MTTGSALHYVAALALALGTAPALTAQTAEDAALEACLGAPTQSCALSAAVATAVAEELPIERARVLVSVARALADIGNQGQASATLALALEEARSVGINFVTQEKLKDIAPVYAQIGEGARAIELAQEIDVRIIREQVLSDILESAYANGDLATAQAAINLFANASRAFWEELNLLAHAPVDVVQGADFTAYEARVRDLTRPDQRMRGLVLLAVIAHKMGNSGERDALLDEASDQYDRIVSQSARANMGALRTSALLSAGINGDRFARSYAQARADGDRLRAFDDVRSFARRIGPIEVAQGDVDSALARLDRIGDIEAQARYLAQLGPVDSFKVVEFYQNAADAVAEIEDRFERDRLRLVLVASAVRTARVDSAVGIARQIEDDDAQAAGLAAIAPIL